MQSKIQLSSFEMELLNKPDWILTKNRVIEKAKLLLEEVQLKLVNYTEQHPAVLPAEVKRISPKISRGENYLGLPWLMLDYPRYFDKKDVFAIRTMFWWGHFFSTTFHVSGKYKQQQEQSMIRRYDELCKHEFYTCIHDDEWQHHFEKENYKLVKEFTAQEFADHIQQRSFIKLSVKTSFSGWDDAINLLSENFVRVISWLNQLPSL